MPRDACQLINRDLAEKLKRMELFNSSLSRRGKMTSGSQQFERVGVDFKTNQPLYQRVEDKSPKTYSSSYNPLSDIPTRPIPTKREACYQYNN